MLGLVDQPWRIPRLTQQQRQQVIATLPPPLLLGLLVALADQHFGGHGESVPFNLLCPHRVQVSERVKVLLTFLRVRCRALSR